MEFAIPPFAIQTLAENAIRHGLAACTRRGRICITARRRDAGLTVVVFDDGDSPARRDDWPGGFGLASLRQRLTALFGAGARVTVDTQYLERCDWLGSITEATTGASAISEIRARRPEIVFLDIRMPDMSGLEVLRSTRALPFVIFTTAFATHALEAFELGAFDYLLKPFGPARFTGMIQRVAEWYAIRAGAPSANVRPSYLDYLFVRQGNQQIAVAVPDIERLQGCDDYVVIVAWGKQHLITTTLRELARRLDPRRFVRVHRSHIVNLDFVAGYQPIDANRIRILMRSRETLSASRRGSALLRDRIRGPA